MLRIAVGADGSGTTLQTIINACKGSFTAFYGKDGRRIELDAQVVLVFGNNPDAFALKRAKNCKILTIVRQKGQNLIELLDPAVIDLVCLAGYLTKVQPEVIEAFSGRILNSHPGPLPEFGGKGMYGLRVHAARLEFIRRTGRHWWTCATIHLVDPIYDHGPVVKEKWIPIRKSDTPESLQERLLPWEHLLYVSAIRDFIAGRLKPLPRRHLLVRPAERKILEGVKKWAINKYH